jgi:short-subunit dehydrogenase
MGNRIAAITGASAGLGTVFARKLAAQGYDLLLIARRADRLEKLAGELSATHGVAAEAMTADLSSFEEIDRVAARLAAEPRLGMLVNNAGFGTKGRFWETAFADQVAMHRLHIDATMRLSRAALESMVPRDAGAVINVSSVAAYFRSPANVSYSATKAWMNAFTEGLHLELKGIGSRVVVQALCPGFTYTEFHDAMGADRAVIPNWAWMKAEDVVEASLAGVRSGKLFVVPGWMYKLLVAVGTKFPETWKVALEGRSPHTKTRLR